MKSLLEYIVEDGSPEGVYVGTAYLFERLHDNHEEAPEYADVAFQLMTCSAGEYANAGLFTWQREELEGIYLAEYPQKVAQSRKTVLHLFHERADWRLSQIGQMG